MRSPESGFTQTGLGTGQGETCIGAFTHINVCLSIKSHEEYTFRQAETTHKNHIQRRT